MFARDLSRRRMTSLRSWLFANNGLVALELLPRAVGLLREITERSASRFNMP